jgi:hypothetical protein
MYMYIIPPMELLTLRALVKGVNSLSEIEKEHPLIGKQFKNFLAELQRCCEDAYGRLSQTLGVVRQVSDKPSDREIGQLTTLLSDLPNSNWFKNVSKICGRLELLANDFSGQIKEQAKYVEGRAQGNQPNSIRLLLEILWQYEGGLKEDMREVVYSLQRAIGEAKTKENFSDVRALAVDVQKEIDGRMDEIAKVAGRIRGTSGTGAEDLLDKEIAEKALQTPERVLILSMFFLVFIFSLGAFAFHFLVAYQFVLVTGFALTAVIVVNALYLRTIGAITEKGFIKLMELALLKFFAPLTRRRAA